MAEALDASGAEVVTVAVRRERLLDKDGRSLLDFIDTDRYTILPNTAGCFAADDAVRVARLGRELLDQLDNPGKDWVKLEVLGDKKTLLPDPVGTLEACRQLVADGFMVMCYSSDDNAAAIVMILQRLKAPELGGQPDYPVIVDAGVGTPSDVTIAMELGCDGVLLNTGIAHAQDAVRMAAAMKAACEAGYHGFRAGRIPKKLHATASSPWEGVINLIPGE
jgi:thiazole synthase